MNEFIRAAEALRVAVQAHRFKVECDHLAEQAYRRHLEAENDKIAAQKAYDETLRQLHEAIAESSAPSVSGSAAPGTAA